jgi:hypothetical protein
MTQQKRLGLVLGLDVVMIAGLLIVGLATHSLGVLAASATAQKFVERWQAALTCSRQVAVIL